MTNSGLHCTGIFQYWGINGQKYKNIFQSVGVTRLSGLWAFKWELKNNTKTFSKIWAGPNRLG